MDCKIVSFDELIRAEKWRVEIFMDANESSLRSQWPLLPISELAIESYEAILPCDLNEELIIYIGLENVEAVTGEPVNLEKRHKSLIRSRSKLFTRGQILYGRLRPYLRKAFLAVPPFEIGICSTEFIVISPNTDVILPQLLRTLLVSHAVTEQLAKFQSGVALPRISSKDFFSLSLPVPPLHIQHMWLEQASLIENEYREARERVRIYPSKLDSSLEDLITGDVDVLAC